MQQWKKHIKLFVSMLSISAFTFGGGFVIVTLMKRRFVDQLHWISEEEMLDLVALAQSSPGAIAVNAAILVGWKVGGALGVAAAVLGTIIPPMGILGAISLVYELFQSNFYVKLALGGMQAGVAAVILDVVCDLGRKVLKERSIVHIAVMVLAFAAVAFLKINMVQVVLAVIAFGVAYALLGRRMERRA